MTDQSQFYKTSPKLRFDFMVRTFFAKKERLKKTNLLIINVYFVIFQGSFILLRPLSDKAIVSNWITVKRVGRPLHLRLKRVQPGGHHFPSYDLAW